MKNITTNIKKFAVVTLLVFNIALAGFVGGFLAGRGYEKDTNKQVQSQAQALLKSIPVAQASTSKAQSR